LLLARAPVQQQVPVQEQLALEQPRVPAPKRLGQESKGRQPPKRQELRQEMELHLRHRQRQ
jgi:hypothetical protein